MQMYIQCDKAFFINITNEFHIHFHVWCIRFFVSLNNLQHLLVFFSIVTMLRCFQKNIIKLAEKRNILSNYLNLKY